MELQEAIWMKRLLGGGGAAGGADWEQEEETGAGYIRSRPCHGSETVLLEQSVATEAENGRYSAALPALDLTEGDRAVVYVDGTAYRGSVETRDGLTGLGNFSLASGTGADTGEPFCLLLEADGSRLMTEEEKRVGLRVCAGDLLRLSGQYLPYPVCFDLTAAGLPVHVLGGTPVGVYLDGAAAVDALEQGRARFKLQVEAGGAVVDAYLWGTAVSIPVSGSWQVITPINYGATTYLLYLAVGARQAQVWSKALST